MNLVSRFGIAALVSLVGSSLIAMAGYSLGLWMGFPLMVYLSVPFAVLLGVSAVIVPLRKVDQKGRLTLAVLVGTVLGILYAYLMVRLIRDWPAFIVLGFLCWIPSGISAMAAANSRKHLLTAIGIVVLCLSTVVLMEPIFNAAAHNEQLTVALITPSEISAAQMEAQPETLGFKSDEEIQTAKYEVLEFMRTQGYRESFRVMSITRRGKGRKSLAILVVRTPITKQVVLPVPDSAKLVYVQQPQNWERVPAQIPVLHRGITIMPTDHIDGSVGFFEIPDARGISLMGRISQRTSTESR